MIKDFFKRNWLWIVLILISITCCVLNIVYSCQIDDNSNLFTAISGWVSGIATAILGVIAVVQNRKYVLYSTKLEIKDMVKTEQEKFIELCDEMSQFSRLKSPLFILVNNKITEKDLISYNFEIETIREYYLVTSHKVQSFKFIPNNMSLIVEKLMGMLNYTYEDYKKAEEHYASDDLLASDIKNIGNFLAIWVLQVIGLRNKAVNEYTTLIRNVNEAKSVKEIQNLLQNIELQTRDVQEKTGMLLNSAQKIKQEQNNG